MTAHVAVRDYGRHHVVVCTVCDVHRDHLRDEPAALADAREHNATWHPKGTA